MIEINFDINKVVSVEVYMDRPAYGIQYKEERRVPKFPAFIRGYKTLVAGYYDNNNWDGDEVLVSIETLLRKGYIIDDDKKLVYDKPYVTIRLTDKIYYSKTFGSNRLALEWVEELRVRSGKDFEVIGL